MVDSVFEINTEDLKSQGIKGIIFDLDNTIIPWDSSDMCPRITAWLQDILAAGFQVAIVSNNWQKRVQAIAGMFGIPFVSRAYKPAKVGFKHALKALNLPPREVAVVGDQMFTDILGGNRLGFYTIWVKPINAREFIGTRITRQVEKLAVHMLKSKGLLK
jgi:HAD superfamily phosphatase (TIGR01668 family)